MEDTRKTCRLENWYVDRICPGDPAYAAPETFYSVLCGNVYGHPGFENGTEVEVGTIVDFDPETRTISTRRTHYKLGYIKPHYEDEYPNAFETLAESFKVKKDC